MVDKSLFRRLPGVDQLLSLDGFARLLEEHPRALVVKGINDYLDTLRNRIKDGSLSGLPDDLAGRILDTVTDRLRPPVSRIINATGTVISHEFGRSPRAWGPELDWPYALCRIEEVEERLAFLAGAEDALLVNSGFSALLLAINCLVPHGGGVVVAAGQLIQVGDVRVSDIVEAAGCGLVEVGCTNRVHEKDYVSAIDGGTGAVLYVNRPNVWTLGFTKELSVPELADVAGRMRVPFIVDEGAGVLVDLLDFGLPRLPKVQEHVAAGADLVTFSTDKFMGGPRGGFVCGKRSLIGKMRSGALLSALRPDRRLVSCIDRVVRTFFDPSGLAESNELYRILSLDAGDVEGPCLLVASAIDGAIVRGDFSSCGMGAPPSHGIATTVVEIPLPSDRITEVGRSLRRRSPSVRLRCGQGSVICDLRTVLKGEEQELIQALLEVL